MVGADGKCYAWDARAQGYGRGEGIAALVLKPLSVALRDGDHVHAVIRETGLNQDGATKSITSPSIEAQIKLIEKCYNRAGLDLSDTGYVEAHMTGTPVGDLAEATALAHTFGKARKAQDPIYVGSIKTNVGHTEAASGLAGIIKAIFAMNNRIIPPNLNYQYPNPKISLEEWNLAVPTELIPWPKDKALRASINNFGYGGANSHVILEAAPAVPAIEQHNVNIEHTQSRVFLLSAKDQVAAKSMMRSLAEYANALSNDSSLGGIAYTLAERRTRFPWVAAVRASTHGELAQKLDQSSLKASNTTKRPRLGFVLNGQGAQWHAMGRELIGTYPIFREAVYRADKALGRYGADWSLIEELNRDAKTTRVGQMHLSQPVTVALQLCLLDLLDSWGIRPSALSSHSSGEIAAAYAVGAITFDEAVGAAYYRGSIPSKNKELSTLAGGMLAAGIGNEEATKYIADTASGHVVIACQNSPDSVTISGDLAAIDEVEARLSADGIFARKLKVPLAYHSHHMQLLAKEYTDRLRETIVSRPSEKWASKYRYASPVLGKIITAEKMLRPEYFVHNLTQPVLFSQAFQEMCFDESGTSQVDVIVEIGAHGTLAGPMRQMLKGREIPYVSTLSRNVDAVKTMQNLVVELLGHGCDISLPSVNCPTGGHQAFVHDLPTYAWNHSTRYWVESRISKELRNKKFPPHELLGSLLPGDNGLSPTWRNFLRLTDISWLNDHQIQGYVVLPGAGYVAMAVEATRLLTGPGATITSFELQDIEVLNALTVPEAGVEVQLNTRPKDGGYEFTVSSLTISNTWTINCTGFIRAESKESLVRSISTNELFHPGVKAVNIDPESLWADLRKMSMFHGPTFRPITNIQTARDKSITDIKIKNTVEEVHDYLIHPTTLDGIFIAAYNNVPKKIRDAFTIVPRKFKGITIHTGLHNKGGEDIKCFSQMHNVDSNGFDASISVTNGGEAGTVSLLVDHFVAQAIPRDDDESDEKPGIISRLEWEVDLTSTIPAALKESLKVDPENDKPSDFDRKVRRVAFHFIHDAVAEFSDSPESVSPAHAAYFEWMKSVVAMAASGELGPRSNTWARTSKGVKVLLADEVGVKGTAATQLLVRVGQQLPQILRGEIEPVELLKTDNLLNKYYVQNTKLEGASYTQLTNLVEKLAISRPGTHVLELGAGTGAATKAVFEAFGAGQGDDGTRTILGKYDFTDTSKDTFDAVAPKFSTWKDLMNFKQLDIEKDIHNQGFTTASYDLIIASQVFYNIDDRHAALANVHKLLRPGGKLVLIETTQEQIDQKLVFGVMPRHNINLPVQGWDDVLLETGFSGVQLEVGDSEDIRYQSSSVLLAGKNVTSGSYPSSVVLVHAGHAFPERWSNHLGNAIQAQTGATFTVKSLHDAEISSEATYIFTPELVTPLISNLDRASFESLKGILGIAQNILWLSSGGLVDAEEPLIGATCGLLRVIRQEDAGKRCVHLDFAKTADGDPWTEDKIDHIVDIYKRTFDLNNHSQDHDWEYSVKDSILYVPRSYPELQCRDVAEPASFDISNDNATYLVIGGMGGIGQDLAAWMMENGAKNLLLLSRNAAINADVPRMKAMAAADGCNLQVRSCDIGNEQHFVDLLAEVTTDMPPIKGVINAAMILKVCS